MPPLRRDRTDCGDRLDIVSYGYSSGGGARVETTSNEQPISQGGTTVDYTAGKVLDTDGFCSDHGAYAFASGLFGTDTADCGERHMTMPSSKTGPVVPDDSCPSSRNDLCEDQLYYSRFVPNDNRFAELGMCLPNTEWALDSEPAPRYRPSRILHLASMSVSLVPQCLRLWLASPATSSATGDHALE